MSFVLFVKLFYVLAVLFTIGAIVYVVRKKNSRGRY